VGCPWVGHNKINEDRSWKGRMKEMKTKVGRAK